MLSNLKCHRGVVLAVICSLMTNSLATNSLHSELISTVPADFGFDEKKPAVVVLGSGPAACGAAMKIARAGFSVKMLSGPQPAGQLNGASLVENVPGLEPQDGLAIMDRLHSQAQGFGAELAYETAVKVDFQQWPYKIYTDGGEEITTLAVVIATGGSARTLKVPGEEEYLGRGISTCARCDALFFKEADVAIVGGGETAVEYALLLLPYVRSIKMLVRADAPRASPVSWQRLQEYPQVSVHFNKKVTQIMGEDEKLTGVMLTDTRDNSEEFCAVTGLFLAIGHLPNSQLVADALPLDHEGYIHLPCRGQATQIPGVFAAGDVADPLYHQVEVALGDGAKAGLEAVSFLHALEGSKYLINQRRYVDLIGK